MGKKETRPKDKQKVSFTGEDGESYEGMFIDSEDMFFIGFEDSGDFLYASQVESWKPLD
jgi:hypothetical protein